MHTIYFDTNVYRFVNATKENSLMRQLLRQHNLSLVASSSNLFETFAIKAPEKAKDELSTVVELATRYEERLQSWQHAFELRQEIRRLRPHWQRSIPSPNRIREFLKQHRKLWQLARNGEIPNELAFSTFRRDFEQGVSHLTSGQRDLRSSLRAEASNYSLLSPDGVEVTVNAADPEIYWRLNNLQVWYNAIQSANPASRDYADWLCPYLKRNCFKDSSYIPFWLQEVSPDRLPFNRLSSLINYYQSTRKVTHGNAVDQAHASHWLGVDVFVTADRAFFEVLSEVAAHHFPDFPQPAFLNRSAPSAVDEIDILISSRKALW